MANGFHIDGNGNLWIGSASNNFDNNAAFYVKTDGEMKATSGEIGGLDIESNRIKSTSYSNTNSQGFQIHSDGTAKFYGSLTANSLSASGANISGNITATDGTIGGTQINSSNIESTSFDANTGYQIGANSATFHDVTITGTLDGATIDGTVSGTIATANSGTRVELSSGNDAGFIRYYTGSQQTGTIGSSSDGLSLDAGTAQYITLASATGIKSFGPWYYFDGSSYTTGSSGKVIVSDSNGNPSWGNVPANSGVTAIQASSNVFSLSANTGSIVLGDNHTSNHHASSDHTGNGNTNLATLAYVNSRGFTSNNGNSNLGTHGNGSHNDLGFGTGNSNLNSSAVTSLINANIAVNSGYNHAQSTHNNGNGNGNMTSTSHFNSNISINTHYHPNTIIHDSRLLNVNANTVPGVNFINRLNPVQTNFIGNVESKLTDKENISGFITDHLQATAFTLTAQDVEQALADDGHSGDYAIYLDNVDYYTEEHSDDLPEGETVKGFSQEHMIPVLVQAIKDLSATIQTLEDRITTLEG
jgi:hypothetical protein